MPRKNSLSRADFARMQGPKAVRAHGTFFSLAASPLPSVLGGRTACVVSKKIAPHAADRNLIRRRCREAIRISRASLPPLALVFTAKREAARASFAEIERDVRALLVRV